MKHIHLVMPYQSMAMQRMAAPLQLELRKLYEVTTSEQADPQADLNYHIPFHTITPDLEGRHAMMYTHCNKGAGAGLMEACNKAELITCMSFEGRRELVDFGVDPAKLWTIYASSQMGYRKRIIGIVGYPQPNGRKRESLLIDLAWKMDLSPFEFLFVGKGWEEIAGQMQSLGVAVTQVYVDADEQLDEKLSRLYGIMDTLLITGYTEGGPLPLLEAMAAGVNVLSPRFGYAADLLDDENIYDDLDLSDLMDKLNERVAASIKYHKLSRAWSWSDYAAEHALAFGRLLGESVDLYPERGESRYAQILDIIAEEKPTKILEVGTWNGKRAIQMIQEAAKYKPTNRIKYTGYDLFETQTGEDYRREFSKVAWPEDVVKKRIEATGANVQLVKGYTMDTLKWTDADLYFVDGGHSEETIAHDGAAVLESMPEGATVIFDDYYHPAKDGIGCNRFINGLDRERHEITHLPIQTDADGMKIGMVKVKRANVCL